MINIFINIIKRIFYPLLGISIVYNYFNPIKTIIVNYHVLGLRGLLFHPIYVYNNVKIYNIGNINFSCNLYRGMVKIGRLDVKSKCKTKIFNYGIINIHGPLYIESGSILENFGKIDFYGYNHISNNCSLFIRKGLQLGKYTRIGFNTLIMDSDDHYVLDINTSIIKNNTKPIILGSYNWIGNYTSIKKGVITPDYFIVSSSFCTLVKDYSDLPCYSVVGGSPAKLIKSGIRRVFNPNSERLLREYFHKKTNNQYKLNPTSQEDIDTFCI